MFKNVLVTGGAGFIGSHVVDRLVLKHYQVIVYDNLSGGNKSFINKESVFIKGDVRDKNTLLKTLSKYKINVVCHIAGQPSIVNSFNNPRSDIDTNFHGTINAVLASVESKVERFIYASSMTVYGNHVKNPISEDYSCVPISYYGISKYCG